MEAPPLGRRRAVSATAKPEGTRPATWLDSPARFSLVHHWSASRMNQFPGVVGRKLGMTQLVAEDGTVTPVTVIEAHAVVVGKRTKDKDGYDAIILGIDAVKEKH